MIAPEALRLAQLLPDPVLLAAEDGQILLANPAAEKLLAEYGRGWRGQRLDELVVDPPDTLAAYLRACARSGQLLPGALTLQTSDFAPIKIRTQGGVLIPAAEGEAAVILLRLSPPDVTSGFHFTLLNQKIEEMAREVVVRRRAQSLLEGQKETLELITQAAPLPTVLDKLVRVAEGQSTEGMLASILLLDRDGRHLRHGAAPSLPAAYNEAIDGVAIGPQVGSCGTAAFRREPVIVTDISTDPLWADFRELALTHGLRACWSTPIFTAAGRVLGTFAIYYRVPRAPQAQDWQLIQLVTRTAALAIERKRAEEERGRLLDSERQARAAAEEASRLKDEFIATVSHELRTPLTAIVGYAHLLTKRVADNPRAAHAAQMILRSAQAQAQIVDDLLDVSRIMAGKLRLNVQSVDLAPVIHAAVETVQPAAEAKGVHLGVVSDPHVGFVWGDPDRLQQVVWNLLSNAIKFTPHGGTVEVRLARQDGQAAIVVTDTGIGIRPDFLPHLFERFRQGDGSSTRQYGGLGLGLSIVRHLVEQHGGVVQAHSDGEGQGAEFTVALPLRPIAPAPVGPDMANLPDRAVPSPQPERLARDGHHAPLVEDEPTGR